MRQQPAAIPIDVGAIVAHLGETAEHVMAAMADAESLEAARDQLASAVDQAARRVVARRGWDVPE